MDEGHDPEDVAEVVDLCHGRVQTSCPSDNYYRLQVDERVWLPDVWKYPPHLSGKAFTRGWVRVVEHGWSQGEIRLGNGSTRDVILPRYKVEVITDDDFSRIRFWCYEYQLHRPVSVELVERCREKHPHRA